MIFPEYDFNWDGDAVIKIVHISESSSERKKGLFDKKAYHTETIVNPVTMEIIKESCECWDYMNARFQSSPCKHIRENIALLSNYGIIYNRKTNGDGGEMPNTQGAVIGSSNSPPQSHVRNKNESLNGDCLTGSPQEQPLKSVVGDSPQKSVNREEFATLRSGRKTASEDETQSEWVERMRRNNAD